MNTKHNSKNLNNYSEVEYELINHVSSSLIAGLTEKQTGRYMIIIHDSLYNAAFQNDWDQTRPVVPRECYGSI